MNETSKIIKYLNTLNIDTYGFMRIREFYELKEPLMDRINKGLINELESKDIDKRINPKNIFEEGKTIISIAFPYFYGYNYENNKDPYFSIYTLGLDYHRVINEYLKKISNFIGELGGKCYVTVDSNDLPERYIASLQGIGFIGQNGCFYTKKYGSYVFLAEIITDLELHETNFKVENKCSSCGLCIKACPTGALKEKNFNKCMSYITQKKEIDDEYFTKFNGRMFGCDLCQRACPLNKDVSLSSFLEFKPLPFMSLTKESLEEIISMDNNLFKNTFKITSCGFRGKNVLKRNAIINYLNIYKDKNKLNKLLQNSSKSPYINEYTSRLLNVLHL